MLQEQGWDALVELRRRARQRNGLLPPWARQRIRHGPAGAGAELKAAAELEEGTLAEPPADESIKQPDRAPCGVESDVQVLHGASHAHCCMWIWLQGLEVPDMLHDQHACPLCCAGRPPSCATCAAAQCEPLDQELVAVARGAAPTVGHGAGPHRRNCLAGPAGRGSRPVGGAVASGAAFNNDHPLSLNCIMFVISSACHHACKRYQIFSCHQSSGPQG
jgi:hypothetical protein